MVLVQREMPYRRFNPGWPLSVLLLLLVVATVMVPLAAQSNHATTLIEGGAWHLHSRVPLGFESLLLLPSRIPVELLASAEVPEFEGWTLASRERRVVLLDAHGRPVETLPKSVTFRVTVGTHNRLLGSDPMPFDSTKTLNEFLLDMHFHLQVFRGMQMRQLEPVRTWMIGVPLAEASDERIYRSTFDLDSVRPDDRLVLLVTDGNGTRLTKFHLEFL